MRKVELACLAHPRVKEEIEALKLPDEATVVIEPWTYGADGENMSQRITICWFYMRLSSNPDANYYAYPLDLCAEISLDMEVAKVYRLPSGENGQSATGGGGQRSSTAVIFTSRVNTTPVSQQIVGPAHDRIRLCSLMAHHSANSISWEKWTMRVGFNYREGMTLHGIRYDGRSLFYRLSPSEMFVPYADPRSPFVRKAAFDIGNDGAGACANNLKLGCDCLGQTKYFDGWLTTLAGVPLKLPNVICCHEVDDGILWKHTNFRTGNAVVTRSRLLVLQTIITVSNYEYIFLFYFGQDASIHYEIRATGILSTAPIAIGDTVPYGAVVAPGVLAPYHQHLFCLRIDPALDSHRNSLVVEESHTTPFSPSNPYGVGYATKSATIAHELGLDLKHSNNRTFKIVNESRINPTTGTPVGFKLVPCYSALLLAHPDSFHARRSEFGTHAVWVTRYHDDEMFPSGKFTMQSTGGEGIASWIRRRRRENGGEEDKKGAGVRDEDIVLWHTFGSTHHPRAEDWPVMPCEKMMVGLKPVNFFERNPGLDVAVSTQEKNLSVLVEDVSLGA